MTGIYKITNNINGKAYIGQARDIFLRWKQHKQVFETKKSSYTLYKAFEKYGFENFSFSIVEELDYDENLLNEREKFWIKTLHTYLGDPECVGYNMTLGGEGKAHIDIYAVYDLWDSGKSIAEISTMLNHDRCSIRKCLINHPLYNETEARFRGGLFRWQQTGEGIEQYSLTGEYINSFPNMAEAERQSGVSSKNIWNAVNGKSYTAGGYQWKRLADDKEMVDVTTKTKKQKQPVVCIKEDGSLIKFESSKEAERQTGISSVQIRKVCQNKGKTAGGYVWRYMKEGDFNERQDNFS